MFRRKNGEKAILLNKCGETLFGCPGELLVTQGIYVPKSLSSSPFHFICKRTVWAPVSISYECLVKHLTTFSVTLPFSVQRVASLHRFGLCGINPTRTVHAIDKQFLLLAKVPQKYFAIYGIVEISESGPRGLAFIESISINRDEILNCVNWMQREFTLYHLEKESKKKKRHSFLTEDVGDKESEIIITESEPPTIIQETQDPIQHESVETESEVSINTQEHPNLAPCEHVDPQNVGFNSAHLQNPNTIYWIPCLPQQSTPEPIINPNPFFIPTQLYSLSKPSI